MRHLKVAFCLLCLGSGFTASAVENYDYQEGENYWEESEAYGNSVNFEADIGLHMTPVGFGSQISLYQHLSSFFHIGQTFLYYRNDEGNEQEQDLHYGVDLNMRVAPFQDYMFAPFASVAFGYNRWQDAQTQSESPRVSYDIGLNIQLAKFFSLVLVHRDLSFMDEVPTKYWGQNVSGKSFESNEAMLTFSFDNSMF